MSHKNRLAFVGVSQLTNSTEAARQAAEIVLQQAPLANLAGWALCFCGGRHDEQVVFKELRAQLGQIELIGGAAIGLITNHIASYSGYECGLMAFSKALPNPEIVVVTGLAADEVAAGRQLGAQLCQHAHAGDTVLLFYDSLRAVGPPPILNVGSYLLDGLYQSLGDKPIHLVGGGTLSDLYFTGSFVFAGQYSAKNTVVAVILPSALQAHTTIMHGCIPVSTFLEITKIEGATLYELNGEPALNFLLNASGQHADTNNLSLTVTIGEKQGDIFAPYNESNYVNRLILTSNPADGSVTLFEADFKVGTKVQIMSRDNQLMLESVRNRTRQLLNSLDHRQPIFALYIDCAGRTNAFSGAEQEEAGLVQAALGPDIPLLGFYSGVEIGPLLGRSRPLDWTGVLTLFTLDGQHL